MIEQIIFFIFILIFNLLFINNFKHISELINIYDYPNSRKIHKKKIPQIGGFLFVFSIIFYTCFNQFQINYTDNFFNLSLIIFLLIFFCIGLIDDKFELNSLNKILLFFFFLFFLVYFNENLHIKSLRFQTLNIYYELDDFKIAFPIICIFLFLNAYNMYDGINGQSGLYTIIIFSYFIIKDIHFYFSISIVLTSIFFVFLNLKNKFFLGNSGSLLVALLISTIIINNYNTGKISNCEEIFILFMLPGVDMARLFIQRILNKKNPFKADNNHLHHLLLRKYNPINVIIINSTFVLFFIVLFYFNVQGITIILFFIIIYFFILYLSYVKK